MQKQLSVADFQQAINPIAHHYTQFQVDQRILLTGHSHQAWPDVALKGIKEAWQDAAMHLDDKWQFAFDKSRQVEQGFARLLNDSDGDYTLAENTHTLVVRFLSALDLRKRPRLVTSDSEFHSIRRQLDRLAEEGIEIVRVASLPHETFTERLTSQINDNTAAVLVSSVFYNSGRICSDLSEVMEACERQGAELLIDAYHHLNVLPFDVTQQGLQQAYIVGGGYKYCQLGEGNCFLRIPPECQRRPVITGWYADFESLDKANHHQVNYGSGGQRFAAATYDPGSHYRAAKVFEFFAHHGLHPQLLRDINQHQTTQILDRFDVLDLPETLISRDHKMLPAERGGFVAFKSAHAPMICSELHREKVFCDHRGDMLRIGPAPYLSDRQLHHAMDIFATVTKKIALHLTVN
ncbi:MAG: aminotransferase class V-fold PLP-dependent enzyme [Thiotrichaceae bacterium]|nr:aminotransferase class V-fold PLP-dependent enzyme [Thiotrichaceae bacterium]